MRHRLFELGFSKWILVPVRGYEEGWSVKFEGIAA